MNRFCWRLVDFVSRALEPSERHAIRGDLAETGASAGQALRDVLGLVARRQAALWKHWRPWLALGITAPFGLALSVASQSLAGESAIYVWLYAENWTSAYLTNPGARMDLLQFSVYFLLEFLALAAGAWLSGKLIAAIARPTVVVIVPLFCITLLIGGTSPIGIPSMFYAVIFPIIVRGVFVLCPALLGIAYE